MTTLFFVSVCSGIGMTLGLIISKIRFYFEDKKRFNRWIKLRRYPDFDQSLRETYPKWYAKYLEENKDA